MNASPNCAYPLILQMRLSVPFERQINDHYCVPASVGMVLSYHGYPSDQEVIGNILGTTEECGTQMDLAADILREHGLHAVATAHTPLDDLLNSIAARRPIIAVIRPQVRRYAGHAVVVTGYDLNRSRILLNDPEQHGPSDEHIDDFLERWSAVLDGENGNPSMVLAPRH